MKGQKIYIYIYIYIYILYSIKITGIKMTLKFDDVDIKEFYASKQPIISKVIKFLNILLAKKGMMLLDLYVLYCLR